MPDSELTPEEKLLRIIESPKESVRAIRPHFQGLPDLKTLIKNLISQNEEKIKSLFSFKTANSTLVALCAGTSIFLLLDFWIGMPHLNTIQHLETVAKKMDIGNITLERMDPLALYLQEITQRNIFSLPEPAPVAQVQKKTEASQQMTSILTTFKLVGIIWSEAPQAIIEDTKESKTYFVNRGDWLKDIRIKDILKDRVLLSYDDHINELK